MMTLEHFYWKSHDGDAATDFLTSAHNIVFSPENNLFRLYNARHAVYARVTVVNGALLSYEEGPRCTRDDLSIKLS